MNPRYPEPLDPVTKQPRRIPWGRWLLYGGGVIMVLAVGIFLWLRSYSTITVARDTTYLTAPLAADGYPDYIAYLNDLNSAGITPENNAWIPLLLRMDSGEIDEQDRARHCQQLKIPAQGLRPDAFQPFGSRTFRESVSTELLVASSAAAQPPWYVEPLRLSAYNAAKRGERIRELEELVPEEVPADPRPLAEQQLDFAQSFARDGAETMAELAEGPVDALARYDLMTVEEIEAPQEGEFVVPDLREAAMLAKMPPGFTTPEEIAEWREWDINLSRGKLFEREELIVNTRPWSRAECPLAAHWLDTQSAALDRLLAELAARPRFYAPYLTLKKDDDDFALSILLPGLQMLRQLQQGLQTRAYAALQQDDIATAMRDFEAQLRVSTLRPAAPFLVDSLVSMALHGVAMQTLSELAHHPRATAEDLDALAKIMEQSYDFPSFEKSLVTERIAMVDFIVSAIARGKNINLMPDIGSSFMRMTVCWDDVLRRMNELYDRAEIAAKNKDAAAMQLLGQEIETAPADLPQWAILPSQRTTMIKYQFPRLLMGAGLTAFQNALKIEARHAAARVMLALERYRRAHNGYPATLAELVPAFLPAVPNDPFDGQPLRYLRTDGGGYRAYLVGYNGVDDGGEFVLDQNGDYDVRESDLVIGSPDEIPPRLNLAW